MSCGNQFSRMIDDGMLLGTCMQFLIIWIDMHKLLDFSWSDHPNGMGISFSSLEIYDSFDTNSQFEKISWCESVFWRNWSTQLAVSQFWNIKHMRMWQWGQDETGAQWASNFWTVSLTHADQGNSSIQKFSTNKSRDSKTLLVPTRIRLSLRERKSINSVMRFQVRVLEYLMDSLRMS